MPRLYNTPTRRVELLDKQPGDQVSLYTCGPTVYDYAHIGNLRAFIFDDILRRTLEVNGLRVKHVMNITDVGHLVGEDDDSGDDKLEKGAQREGKTVWEVAEAYTEAFKRDMAALNILSPNGYHDPMRKDNYARATDFIDKQIELVQRLLDKGFAYQTESAIYFDVMKLADYGQLSGQNLADKETAARHEVVTDPDKHYPQDFAVWFFSVGRFADHAMRWPSPWGEGFPGWHLECSAIIHATLGEPIDIHTGGVDHIGTHHTNEIAQTEAAYDLPLAKFWLHNEFVLVDGRKMSKSLGNFYTLADIEKKGYAPMVYRLRVLQAHYRSELNFTWTAMEAARNALISLYALADLSLQAKDEQANGALLEPAIEAFQAAMNDDLSTPQALAALFRLSDKLASSELPSLDALVEFFELIDGFLGLGLTHRPDISPDQKSLIADREKARADKDFATADKLRKSLLDQGLDIKDTAWGPRWQKVSL